MRLSLAPVFLVFAFSLFDFFLVFFPSLFFCSSVDLTCFNIATFRLASSFARLAFRLLTASGSLLILCLVLSFASSKLPFTGTMLNPSVVVTSHPPKGSFSSSSKETTLRGSFVLSSDSSSSSSSSWACLPLSSKASPPSSASLSLSARGRSSSNAQIFPIRAASRCTCLYVALTLSRWSLRTWILSCLSSSATAVLPLCFRSIFRFRKPVRYACRLSGLNLCVTCSFSSSSPRLSLLRLPMALTRTARRNNRAQTKRVSTK
mmetsp:Transcript_27719/g.73159  ORF Transcript_27719/g.73159 Transcript_27719/m.73159 type:complete len:262 (+) Transcript_27719:157-942(+)